MVLVYCSYNYLRSVGRRSFGPRIWPSSYVHFCAVNWSPSPGSCLLARSLAPERPVDLVPVVAQPRAPGGCFGPQQPGPVGAGEDLVSSAQVLSSSPCGWPRQWPVCDLDRDSQAHGVALLLFLLISL